MASDADVALVQDSILPNAAAMGWDGTKIGSVLDSGESVTRTIRDFWQFRVANASDFTDVSEAGSTRNMTAVFQHAQSMLNYWDGRVALENTENNEVVRQQITFGTITRV